MLPDELRTARLLLRPWRATDAAELQPILAANVAHLSPWIPRRVAEPADVERLEERLAEFSAAFEESREWRYAMFSIDTGAVLGELSLFPRNAAGRVSFDIADEIEIGYWIRADATAQGLVTEAARAARGVALSLPGISRISIRCDERNAASAGIPRRLGFQLVATLLESGVLPGSTCRLQIWEHPSRLLPPAPLSATLDGNRRQESGHG
jgi:RimJ/RimL family protein N-acetyltransferase